MINWQSLKQNSTYKLLLLILLLCFFTYLFKFHKINPNQIQVVVNGTTIYAQLADTNHKRELGLSYTKDLAENSGMLFVFPDEQVRSFWMKDMNYNIDIVWVDKDKIVTGFYENARKESYNYKYPEYSRFYKSPDNTKYVLEVPEKTISNLKIKVGDKLDFSI